MSIIQRLGVVVSADRGLDDHKLIEVLYDAYQVSPVIDIRNCWKSGGDEVARIPGQPVTRQLNEYAADTLLYDYRGNIYCYCTVTHAYQLMAFKGYEKERRSPDRATSGNGNTLGVQRWNV